jgi:hypothetical protein
MQPNFGNRRSSLRLSGLDRDEKVWEFPNMMAVKVDKTKRVRLRCTVPGDYYAVELTGANVITLRKMEPPTPIRPTTAEAARKAILASKVDFGGSYDDLRKLTRE